MWGRWLLGAACGVLVAAAGARAVAPRSPAPPPGMQEETALRPRVTPEMERYARTRYTLAFAGTLVELLILFGLFRSGISARLRDVAERRSRRRFGQVVVYTVLLSAVYTLAMLPLAFYSGWLLEHRYQLSNQPLGHWAWDRVKGFLIGALLFPPLVALLYLCLARSPRRWWLGFWLASIPLSVILMVLAPVVIDPLFHRFEPLRDPVLRGKILSLARRAGIEGGRVLQVDMSGKTRKMNAYVYGLGTTHRIVLWDTTLAGLKEDEILAVMAHEMGHYVLHHVYWGVALSIGGVLVFLAGTDRIARVLLRHWGPRSRVRGFEDPASLPLLLAVASALAFFGAPVSNAVSRAMERQADQFSLQLTQNGEAAARSFIRLSEQNLSHPDPPPFVEFWLFSHPPLSERIENALAHDNVR